MLFVAVPLGVEVGVYVAVVPEFVVVVTVDVEGERPEHAAINTRDTSREVSLIIFTQPSRAAAQAPAQLSG
jgi:hypothetical protein